MTQILDGKALADKIVLEAKTKTDKMDKKPKLVVIQVGENPASTVYVRNKKRACEKAGIIFEEINFPETLTQNELLNKIDELNQDNEVSGMIVQLPIPKHISVPLVIRQIAPHKDVDGFCAYNLGKMFLSKEFEDLPPATPLGIIKLLDEYNIDVKGMNAVIVGHSNIVGKPLATMLLNRDATVSVCHI
ncbi:MAG: bifunctional 5,10-methylenetetrahydrofolate dehydrogenase/5,10-methenyltetrahydrofolate cyclohydrolase, partial [Candidatus Gracilibacteria bacterium]|nr:bifunctional 5,10-methylenetetrahydrofolate dehydrogenase/5,10-methenyltetrahydrofolate cyclohydrolase [Candidatus Gracilibacteria bacterium]